MRNMTGIYVELALVLVGHRLSRDAKLPLHIQGWNETNQGKLEDSKAIWGGESLGISLDETQHFRAIPTVMSMIILCCSKCKKEVR